MVAPRIQSIDPTAHAGWDQAAARLGGSVFHTAGWAKVLQRTYGYAPVYPAVTDEQGVIQAVLPLVEVRSWLTGNRGVGLPFTDRCEFIGNRSDRAALFQSALAAGRDRRWKYLEIRGEPDGVPGAVPSVRFHGHRIDLRPSATALFTRLDPACQRAIRKARRSGVVVRVGTDLPAMREFYRLLCRTRQRHGLPPQPWRFFAHLLTEIILRERGSILLAAAGDRIIAGMVLLYSGSDVLYKYGASDQRFQEHRPNNLLFWDAIVRTAAAGFTCFDLGRTSLGNAGLRRFKCGWGAEETTIEYFKYDLRSDRFVTDVDRSSGWQTPFFRHVPLPLSRAIGALAYKHVA